MLYVRIQLCPCRLDQSSSFVAIVPYKVLHVRLIVDVIMSL